VQEALLTLPPERVDVVLHSHGIPREALVYLRPDDSDAADPEDTDSDTSELAEGDGNDTGRVDLRSEQEKRFVKTRAAALASREQAFMRDMGVEPPPHPGGENGVG
jgi:hypothetical protein